VAGEAEAQAARARVLLVIPTLGRRLEYLELVLASVRAQQVPVDLVVVTPASAEGARSLAARFGARVLDDPGSLSAAVNLGLGQADGSHCYGNWIGDDDLLAPGALEATCEALDRDQGAVLAFGHCTYIDEPGRPLGTSRAGRAAVWLLPWGPDLVPQPGILFRLADFAAVGGLDESLKFAMDLDLLLRLRRRGRLVAVHQPVSSFRWHQTSLTVSDRSASIAESEQVKRRYLAGPSRRLAPVWELPVRVATRAAARRVGRRAEALAGPGLRGAST
jgi:glycosyltransferase involved in cell wall biosynthesis